ncbi:hypothetical protein AGMMS49941_08090 [Deferribacterales bacterium]|nr:hypothetical protein AGMMS49941_08090 [Deferribacterales bacterium]
MNAIIGQTFRNIEIICIDSASTDNSLEILKEYEGRDSRLRVFEQVHLTAGLTRNVGLRNAKGKYIMFCDADDWYELNACEECYNAIEQENVDWVFFGANVILVDRNKRYASVRQASFELHKLGLLKNRFELLDSSIVPSQSTKMFKRELLNRYNITYPDANLLEDHRFYLQYLMVADTGYALDKRLYNYYMHTGSLTDRADNHLFKSIFSGIYMCLKHSIKFAWQHKMLPRVGYVFLWLFKWARLMCVKMFNGLAK